MSKVALLQDSEIGLIKCHEKKQALNQNPISRYNYVIGICNNSEYNTSDEIEEMTMMRESKIYSGLFNIMKSLGGTLLLTLILLVVPIINIVLYLLIVINVMCYISAIDVFNKNSKKNPDPFRNMIFSAEICESIKNINWCFDIEVSGLLLYSIKLNFYFF